MTTPQQPPPQQPNPFAGVAEATLVAAVATALIEATSGPAALAMLGGLLQAARIPRQAMLSVLHVVMSNPPGRTGFYGPATMASERLNLTRRAQFVVSAARRVGSDMIAARSRGQSLPDALARAVQRERRLYGQHLMATWNRSQAGAQADSAAMTYGLLLGWHATIDAKTSAECRQANGRNFYADHMPLIGYPGAVHPHCRCQPGAPFPGARLVPSHGLPDARRYRRAA